MQVPVVDFDQKPLMPCSPKRARKMILKKEATPFWRMGVFCIRLNKEPSARNMQFIAIGVDPGSKREGFSVTSRKHTLINVDADARTGIKDKMEGRLALRRSRRYRNTPYREMRKNRACLQNKGCPPSTKARYDWKLKIIKILMGMYPTSSVVVEEIQASTKKGAKRWNGLFSPLQVGKTYFYDQLRQITDLHLKQGWETAELRTKYGLHKTKDKMAEDFHAHCVDAWVLSAEMSGIQVPENKSRMRVRPLDFRRRSLHLTTPQFGGDRRKYGGTQSLGFKRGALVKHLMDGLVYVGGTNLDRVSTHTMFDKSRIRTNAKIQDLKIIKSFNTIVSTRKIHVIEKTI